LSRLEALKRASWLEDDNPQRGGALEQMVDHEEARVASVEDGEIDVDRALQRRRRMRSSYGANHSLYRR